MSEDKVAEVGRLLAETASATAHEPPPTPGEKYVITLNEEQWSFLRTLLGSNVSLPAFFDTNETFRDRFYKAGAPMDLNKFRTMLDQCKRHTDRREVKS